MTTDIPNYKPGDIDKNGFTVLGVHHREDAKYIIYELDDRRLVVAA
jgi:hypothetical protein